MDEKLRRVRPRVADLAVPRGGWIKAVRESLGMSAEQLGARIGISKQAVLKIEANEARRSLTLSSLEQAAGALGCRLAYAIVPDEALDARLDSRASRVARRKLERARHSMALEAQAPPPALHELQVRELAQELKARLSRDLWDEIGDER